MLAIEKLGVVNEKFGILYAYTKRSQNFILIDIVL